MPEWLLAADRSLFVFINTTIANPLFDVFMPILTDWNKSVIGWAIAVTLLGLMFWKGGKKGRIVGILLIPLIVLTDQVASQVLKEIFMRPRPCHTVDGRIVIGQIRLLVPCGSGYSFPSSHAVNNFALAVYLTMFYRNYAPVYFTYAFLISLSRIVVGVHFPLDVAGGAMIGTIIALLYGRLIMLLARYSPFIHLQQAAMEHDESAG